MIGERLAEIRKDHGDNQDDLARKLNVSVFAIRSWEQEKSAPSHEMLVRVCRLYQVSSDYLLGLSNIDPVYEQRRRLEQFSLRNLRTSKNMSPTFYGKNAARKIKRKPPALGRGFSCHLVISQEESFLLPVMVDVLDIVIVLQRVNELFHIFNVPCVSELHIVLGYHFHLGGGKDIALPL